MTSLHKAKMNPYTQYYVNQAGNGISGFQGQRFQRGHGFFGRIFSGAILPALKFLGKHALSAGINVAQDSLHGAKFKDSLKNRVREAGFNAADQALERAKMYAQTGRGLKRKKKKCKTKKCKAKKLKKQKNLPLLKSKIKKRKRKSKKKMSTIHNLSGIAPLPELDLFGVPPTQTSIERDLYTEHRPISILDSSYAISFIINTASDEYIQLREAMLHLVLQINLHKTDKTDVTALDWSKVCPVNNFMHSIFKQIDIEINGKPITCASQTYAYKAYLNTILGFSDDAKNSQLSGVIYESDDSTDKDKVVSARSAYITPTTVSADGMGKKLDLMGKLHIDLATQGRAILGGSQIKITLIPNDPKFYLQTPDAKIIPSVTFLNASLFVHRSKVSNAIETAHNIALDHGTVKYPYVRNEVKSFNISSGTLSANIDNVISGVLPRRVFVAFVENKSFIGDLSKNPFNFKHFNVNYISCFTDGVQFPSKPYTPNFSEELYVREYMGLFEALNQLTTDSVLCLNRKAWAN
ncbi:uncharacterized protein B4U79_15200, partial [Dinothrombium tinctorium]